MKVLRGFFVAFPQWPAGPPYIHARTLPKMAFMGSHLPTPSFSRSASALALAAALISPAAPAAAQSPEALAPTGGLAARLAAWYETASHRAPGQWGIAVADETGRMVWSVNPDEPMVPASTVKLLTIVL